MIKPATTLKIASTKMRSNLSYKTKIMEIAKISTTPVDGVLLMYYKGIDRESFR